MGDQRRRLADDFARRVEECHNLVHCEPARALAEARKVDTRLEKLRTELSAYQYSNLRMRLQGIHGLALLKTARPEEAARVLFSVRDRSATPTERAVLGLWLVHLYTHRGEWAEALKEANRSIRHFRRHPPRPSKDGRSLASALLARAFVLLEAYKRGVELHDYPNLVSEVERASREALKACTPKTPRAAFYSLSNLCSLAVTTWWVEPQARNSIDPNRIAAEMRKICRNLKRLGIGRNTVTHAKARWMYGIAMAQSFDHLNRSAENRLMKALEDLLDLGAMAEAARLCLDMCYWYLQEERWEDLETVTATVLYHPGARQLPESWYDVLVIWQRAIERRQVNAVISEVFLKIRGVRVPPNVSLDQDDPHHKHKDRADTLGF